MSKEPQQFHSTFQYDVSADGAAANAALAHQKDEIMIGLLRQLVEGQDRTNRVLEELLQYASSHQRQRNTEIGHWKDANPRLADACRMAATTLNRVQTEFLRNLTEEVLDNEDSLMDGEYMLNEFVDRFGPRLAHLNGVLHVLSSLSTGNAME